MPTITDTHNNGRPGRPYQIRGQMGQQIAGAYPHSWVSNQYRTLPHAFDDLTRDFGDDIYDRMMLDPQVWAAVTILKVGILAQGVKILPCLEEGEEGYEQALRMAEFCGRQIKRLRGFRTRTLRDLLDALAFGHRLAEIEWTIPRTGPDAGLLTLSKLMVRPRKVTSLLVDPWMNVVGVLALIPGKAPTLLDGTFLGSVKDVANLLPRTKVAILSMNVRDEDPRGRSSLRSIYTPWWMKRQIEREWLKGTSQFGTPTVVGITSEMAAELPQRDADGAVVLDADGVPLTLQPEVSLRDQLIAMQNGTVITAAHGTVIETLKNDFDGKAIEAFMSFQNTEIVIGLLLQKLANQEGEHQARAASQTQQDLLGDLILDYRTQVEEMIEADLCEPLIRYNYGEEWLPYVPEVSLGDTKQEDKAQMWSAAGTLQKAGYLTPSQYRKLDAILGLPIRDPSEVQVAQELFEAGPDMLKEQQQQGDGAQDGGESDGNSGA